MLIAIVTHTPAWVWGLLACLLALGLWQRRTRRVAPVQLLALPLALLAMGLWSMAPAFAALPPAGVLWLAALAAGTALGQRLRPPPGTLWCADERRLHLPGSWLPLLLIVTVFALRYANGVASTMHPEWRGVWLVQAPLALVFGALSGLFLGRALGLQRLARPQRATIAGDASRPLA